MKKSAFLTVVMLGAALSASAITTTLEYEDQREAASRAAISNEITAATVNARDVADLAVYGKVGVGATWMLIGDDGAMTNSATGVFTDSGDGLGSWAFYVGGRLVAASYATCTTNDYEIEWRGGRDVGLAGVALRSYGFRPTADRLATTNDVSAYIGVATNALLASLAPAVSAIVTNISDNWTGELGTLHKVLHEDEWEGRLNQLSGGSSYRVVLDYVGSNVWNLMDDASGLDDLFVFAQGSAKTRRLVFELADDSTTATLLGTNKIVLVREGLLSEYPRFEDVDQAIASATNNIPRPDMSGYYTKGETDDKIVELAPAPGNYETVSNRAMNAITIAPEVFATNLIKTVMSNSLYNLTYDQTLGVTWRKTAEGGAFYERCYTNVNMIGVRP